MDVSTNVGVLGPDDGRESMYARLLELSLDAFTIMDVIRDDAGAIIDFRWRYVNPAAARALNKSREDLQGARLLEVLPGNRERSTLFESYVRVIETGESHDYELYYESDDICGWFRNMAVKLGDGIAVCFSDITARKNTEAKLRESEARYRQLAESLEHADRRKDEFLAMLAHELRNPLAPIRNAVEVLKLLGPPDTALEQMRDTIERQVMHLSRLVDDLLDVSRITLNKIALRRELLHVDDVIHRALEAARPSIDKRRHRLVVSLGPDPMYVRGDLTRLAQVISNLLNNAAKYTEDRGTIELSATEQGRELVISVKDDGIGIPREELPHVFDLFTQAHRSMDRAEGGLGIGLTIVQRLVDMHGGRVQALSDGPGLGSEFRVYLPLATPDEQEDRPAVQGAAALAPQSLKILVVDDSVDAAETMALMLQFAGHETSVAYDGPKALAVARETQPDVILLDIGLPGMDGYEVARRLRADPATRAARIIALTGYGRPEDRQQAFASGCDLHLTKPVSPEQLEAALADTHD